MQNSVIKNFIFVFAGLAVLLILLTPALASAQNLNVDYPRLPVPGGSFDLNKAVELDRVTLGVLMVFLFVFLIWVSGFILFFALLYTGFLYLTSGENATMRAKAKERVTNVFWGMGILMFSYIIIFLISPDITNLRVLGLEHVEQGAATHSTANTKAGTETNPGDEGDITSACEAGSNETLLTSSQHSQVATAICEAGGKAEVTDGSDDYAEISFYISGELNLENQNDCGGGDVSAVEDKLDDEAISACQSN